MRTFRFLSVMLIACPAAAFSATGNSTQPTLQQPKATAAPTKLVCREIVESGTRFKRKACGRVTDWSKLEDDSRRAGQAMAGQGANSAKGD